MDTIQWKPVIINGEKTNYEVSEFSNVRNITTGKLLTASRLQGSERERVHLHINGRPVDIKIYRLSYEAFFGPIPPEMTLDHIDENIHNNHISNFRLLTPSQNIKSYLSNHPDHGFQKVYSDESIQKYFEDLKSGMYYGDAAKKYNIPPSYAFTLLHGGRRTNIWKLYKPFPKSAHRKSYLSESDKMVASALIIDGYTTRDILRYIEVEYDAKGIDAISKLRQKLGVMDPKYFDRLLLSDIDRLIASGKTNNEIADVLSLERDQRVSDMLARRRKKLGIPNNNCTVGDHDEIVKIKSYIWQGLSNDMILEKIGKSRNMYYVNLFGRLRQELKKSGGPSSTIESIA